MTILNPVFLSREYLMSIFKNLKIKNMNKNLCLLFLLLSSFAVKAQSNSALNSALNAYPPVKLNTAYLQLFGNGIVLSANYERQLFKKPGLSLHAGIGICGEAGFYWNGTSRVTIPVGIIYLLPLKRYNRFVDFGIGATYAKSDMQVYMLVEHRNPNYVNTNYWSCVPSISYRIHTQKHMMYKYGFTPVINQYGFIPFFEFSAGKRF